MVKIWEWVGNENEKEKKRNKNKKWREVSKERSKQNYEGKDDKQIEEEVMVVEKEDILQYQDE